MTRCESILFTHHRPDSPDEADVPECFGDLRLDQVVGAIVGPRSDDDLERFFYAPARDVAEVGYRHAVFRDLQRDSIRQPISAFANRPCSPSRAACRTQSRLSLRWPTRWGRAAWGPSPPILFCS